MRPSAPAASRFKAVPYARMTPVRTIRKPHSSRAMAPVRPISVVIIITKTGAVSADYCRQPSVPVIQSSLKYQSVTVGFLPRSLVSNLKYRRPNRVSGVKIAFHQFGPLRVEALQEKSRSRKAIVLELFAQVHLLNFSRCCVWNFINESYIVRHPPLCDLARHEIEDGFL